MTKVLQGLEIFNQEFHHVLHSILLQTPYIIFIGKEVSVIELASRKLGVVIKPIHIPVRGVF